MSDLNLINFPISSFSIYKTTKKQQKINIKNIQLKKKIDGKNHMLPTGELLVYNITRTDALKIYRCRTHHKLTQDSVVSSNVGKIQLTGNNFHFSYFNLMLFQPKL